MWEEKSIWFSMHYAVAPDVELTFNYLSITKYIIYYMDILYIFIFITMISATATIMWCEPMYEPLIVGRYYSCRWYRCTIVQEIYYFYSTHLLNTFTGQLTPFLWECFYLHFFFFFFFLLHWLFIFSYIKILLFLM